MALTENWLPTLQRTIREFIVLPENEPIDKVMFATFLSNHVPTRDVNIWMVLVAPQGEAKSELMNLLIGHPSVWKMPDRLKGGYFLSSMTEERSALFRIDAEKKRILAMADMSALSSVHFNEQDDIATQFRSVHDGHFVHETGFRSRKLEWGPKAPNELLGFIGTGTEDFYRFNGRMHAMGTRFLLYFYDPQQHRHWTDTTDLETILRRQPNKAAMRLQAREQVHGFLSHAIGELVHFDAVTAPRSLDARIADAARLVGRAGSPHESMNAGTRSAMRVRELCRMFAFMAGRDEVDDNDTNLGLRIVFSQIAPSYQRALGFALQSGNRGETWTGPMLVRAVSGTRRVYDPIVAALVDAGIFDRIGGDRGRDVRHKLSDDALRLARKFDPDCKLFHAMPNLPRAVQS